MPEYETCKVTAVKVEGGGIFGVDKYVFVAKLLSGETIYTSRKSGIKDSARSVILEETIAVLTEDGWSLVGEVPVLGLLVTGNYSVLMKRKTKNSAYNSPREALDYLKSEGLLKDTEYEKLMQRMKNKYS